MNLSEYLDTRRAEIETALVDILPLVAQETGIPLEEPVSGSWDERGRTLYATEEPSRLLKQVPALDRDLESGIRWPRKLILTSNGESQLYRLDSDPGEQRQVQDPDLEKELRRELGELRSALVPLEPDSTPHTMTPAARARLQALGYLESVSYTHLTLPTKA